LGYSLYDTVVVFDKVRENTLDVEFSETTTFASQVNLAINQTLVRSVNTSVVAVLPVAAILFVGATALGAGTLRDISLALFIGIIAGTYSSVFLAGPLYVDLRSREGRFKDKTASAKL
jgi:preprotein translocase subunit SecF